LIRLKDKVGRLKGKWSKAGPGGGGHGGQR